MPHYADGTEARVGDVVLAKKHFGQAPHPIQGYVLAVYPGEDSCNVDLAYLGRAEVFPPGPEGSYAYFRAEAATIARDLELVYRPPAGE
jgi:hypothetical protein